VITKQLKMALAATGIGVACVMAALTVAVSATSPRHGSVATADPLTNGQSTPATPPTVPSATPSLQSPAYVGGDWPGMGKYAGGDWPTGHHVEPTPVS